MAYTRYVARIPIVPDDFINSNIHKDHELVMDFEKDDLYVKKGDGYVNITGQIKEDIKTVRDGSSVIHIVTESTLPQIQNRPENNWYYVITRAQEMDNGGQVITSNYIYYGLIDIYDVQKNYLLISQNVTDGINTLRFDLMEGYVPCFYIPVIYSASFTDHETGEQIDFSIRDRIYALNTVSGTYNAYDVYVLDILEQGTYFVDLDLIGTNAFYIRFDTNVSNIAGLVLPETIAVNDGDVIGPISEPEKDDPRYDFQGWSTSKYAPVYIDTETYKPEESITLYAWYVYNDNEDEIPYYYDQDSALEVTFSDYEPQNIGPNQHIIVQNLSSFTRYIVPGEPIGELNTPEFSVVDDNDEPISDHAIEFLGWCENTEYPDIVITSDYIVNNDMVLYAIFIDNAYSEDEKYTVVFNVSDVHVGSYRVHTTESHNPIAIDLTPGDTILEHVMDPDFEVYDENNNLVTDHNISFTGWCTDPSDTMTTKVDQDDVISNDMILYPIFTLTEQNNVNITVYLNQEMDQEYLEWLQIEFDNEFPMIITVPQGTTIRDIIQNNIHYHTTNDDTGLSYARQLSTNAEYSGYQWWLSYDYVPTEDMTLYVVMDYDIL